MPLVFMDRQPNVQIEGNLSLEHRHQIWASTSYPNLDNSYSDAGLDSFQLGDIIVRAECEHFSRYWEYLLRH